MSRQAIQNAVFTVVRSSGQPLRVRTLMERIREKPEFRDVPDFDLRSAILALTANGTLQSTSTNELEIRHAPAVAPRG